MCRMVAKNLEKYLRGSSFLEKYRLQACNFNINKLFHSFFPRILFTISERLHYRTGFCRTPTFAEHFMADSECEGELHIVRLQAISMDLY